MKAMTLKKIVLVLGLLSAATAHAETPLKLGSEVIRIQGASRASAAISAIVFYKPLYKYDKNVSTKGCEFPEDSWKPNENDVSTTIKAQLSKGGGYSLAVPTQGIRGTCPYVLESLTFYMEDKPVSQSLTILSERQVQKLAESLSDIGGLETFPLSNLKGLYCEFETDFEYGFCYPAQDTFASFYKVADGPAIYTLDIKDISERPERQYEVYP
jgi:hypothetical protein